MNGPALDDKQRRAIATSVEAFIRIAILVGIALACFRLLRPFLVLSVWGGVLAIAFYPLFLKIKAWFGGRSGLAATLLSLVLIVAVAVPTVILSETAVQSAASLRESVASGNFRIPPPSDRVADWPVIGERAYAAWSQAATNFEAFAKAFKPQLLDVARRLAGTLAGGGLAVLLTIAALGLMGVFLAHTQVCVNGLLAFARRLAGKDGVAFVEESGLVVRSVATGVIGIALIQALLGGSAMAIIGVPWWPLWTLILLALAVAQIPPLIVMGPVIVYVFATASGITAVIFAIWGILVSISDAFLKPLLLGRGLEIPMLVILLGAIGGMIANGVIGLFTGAVVLAIGWKLVVAYVSGSVEDEVVEPASAAGVT